MDLVGASADFLDLRHDHGGEPAISLQHADLTDDWVLHVGIFDHFRNVLATLGDDEGGGPARDV